MTVSVRPDELEVFCLGGLPGNMTLDKLFKKHHSVRRNEALAMVFHAAGFVEACESNGNRIPSFSEEQGGLSVTMLPHKVETKSEHVEDEHAESEIDSLLNLIRKDPKITAVSIAKTLGISERTVRTRLDDLRKRGIIERKGSRKTGEWIIIEDE